MLTNNCEIDLFRCVYFYYFCVNKKNYEHFKSYSDRKNSRAFTL
jgi:hypothetical protein